MGYTGDNMITAEGKRLVREKALKLVKKHSPDLSKKVAIRINTQTTIYVSPEMLEKRGVEYYYTKYKNIRYK